MASFVGINDNKRKTGSRYSHAAKPNKRINAALKQRHEDDDHRHHNKKKVRRRDGDRRRHVRLEAAALNAPNFALKVNELFAAD